MDLRIALSTSTMCYDVIILVETWLNDSFGNLDCIFNNYNVYRLDRNPETSEFSKGGGVLVAIRNIYSSEVINIQMRHIEQIFVKVRFNNSWSLFGAIYLPPASDLSLYIDHCKTVESLVSIYPNVNMYIVGDFNIPHTTWYIDTNETLNFSSTSSPSKESAHILCEYYNLLNMAQFNYICNSSGSLLDLLFSNTREVKTSNALDPLLSCDSYHPPLVFNAVTNTKTPSHCANIIASTRANFKCADYVSINNYLSSINWDLAFHELNIDEALDLLYYHLSYVTNTFVPSLPVRVSTYPKWFSKDLIKLVKNKKLAHREYKQSNDYSDYLVFAKLRENTKQLSETCWISYINNIESAIPHNVKSFWSFVNNTTASNTLPLSMHFQDQELTNASDIADKFATHFESVYNSDTCHQQYTNSVDILNFSDLSINIGEVFRKTRNARY